MSANIPPSHLDLLTGPFYCVFTTISPAGAPENTVVWCSWDGEYVLVNTAEGRRKWQNILVNPNVAVTVLDPQNPYRWIDVRGTVAEIVPDIDNRNINAHAKLYKGVDEYYGGFAPLENKGREKRLVLKIKPRRVIAFPAT